MKILYVINSGKPGGVEQHVLDLVNSMTSQGHLVYVWCLPGEIADWYSKAGAEVFTQNKIRFDIDPGYVFKLVSFIIHYQIDVVHAHELKAGVNALLASMISLVKVKITHIHTPMSEWQVTGTIKKLITRIQIALYSIMVNLFSSREIALTLSRKFVKIREGIKEEKLEVIPNALNTAKFDVTPDKDEIRRRYKIPENAFVFGNVGRHTEEKGIDILIRAFAEIVKKHPKDPLYLFLIGGGKLEEMHKKLAFDLGISDKVVITGIFSEEEKVKMYSCINVFVFPSRAEGFGIVLMEAMYIGLPIICADLEVLKEVGADTINYFQKGNPNDLVIKMEEMLKNFVPFNQRSRTRVLEEYSLERFKKLYSDLYNILMEKQRR
jgi:glycosyltransferase involved in cell wall biosynthesis